ncbi:MAG: TIGR01459 family HAD-type hydrolase [Propionivibrio sp.]|nr:TIGR01459 family HAD-type hydrolase [Propionivibrio sp.]
MKNTIDFCDGLAAVTERYDAFLIDQWGVLHDGRAPYAGAVDCLRRLVDAGKSVILISNSGRRAVESEQRLNRLGIPATCYSHLVTSGEIAWRMLAAGEGFCGALVGTRCALFASDRMSHFADGLPIILSRPEAADFILLTGMDDTRPIADYERLVELGALRELPLVCANPDLARITPAGLKPGAGAIAAHYAARGGVVHYVGKPHRAIYAYCLGLLTGQSVGRTLAVGDSLHHDIAGGAAAGVDTLLVMNGVHAGELPLDASQEALIAGMRRLVGEGGEAGVLPDWAVPSFRWSPDVVA